MGTRHRVGNGVDNDRARIQVGEGAEGGGGGGFRLFRTTLTRMPAEPFFWRTRESSKIFVEHAWPGADYN